MKGISGRNTESSFRTIKVGDLGLFGLVMSWGRKSVLQLSVYMAFCGLGLCRSELVFEVNI